MKLSSRDILLYLTLKYDNNWERIYEAIINKEDIDYEEADRMTNEYAGEFITILDDEYPQILKHTIKPPFVLLIH